MNSSHLLAQKVFHHPEPLRNRRSVWPVFLPMAGCPSRCSYCDQRAQTGAKARPIADIARTLADELRSAAESGRGPYDLGFYGGTFTALPRPDQEQLLAVGRRFKDSAVVHSIRASTRPDAFTAQDLDRLADQGLDLLELGVQSYDTETLAAVDRGYCGTTARNGCELVATSALDLGIQLLPGLPRKNPRSRGSLSIFREDVLLAASYAPALVRLYPCVVLKGTALARSHAAGDYRPWTDDLAVAALSRALAVFWREVIPVARVGVLGGPGFLARVLAGPRAEDLGAWARALALFRLIKTEARSLGSGPKELTLPKRYSGELWGPRGQLKSRYAAHGIQKENVRYHPDVFPRNTHATEFVLRRLT